jgi:hypothetical protein
MDRHQRTQSEEISSEQQDTVGIILMIEARMTLQIFDSLELKMPQS